MAHSARCPICKNRAEARAENPYAPFCSERCKLIDLGNWLGERYRIPAVEDEEPREAPEQDAAPREPR
ncbi:MAG TPA: DNA gyrase inhibitor YacG [Sandaracinaceae bacterium]